MPKVPIRIKETFEVERLLFVDWDGPGDFNHLWMKLGLAAETNNDELYQHLRKLEGVKRVHRLDRDPMGNIKFNLLDFKAAADAAEEDE